MKRRWPCFRVCRLGMSPVSRDIARHVATGEFPHHRVRHPCSSVGRGGGGFQLSRPFGDRRGEERAIYLLNGKFFLCYQRVTIDFGCGSP